MAKGSNQKLKMLYLVKIFMEETDDDHGLTMPQLISKLKAYGVNADRKTIYMDLEELKVFGIDIITEQAGRKWYYHVGARDFELPEGYCTVITNPPYGERLLDLHAAEELYAVMGERFKKESGKRYTIITPDDDFEKIFGRKADKRRKTYNGTLKCQIYIYK